MDEFDKKAERTRLRKNQMQIVDIFDKLSFILQS